jgi:hypothetical protein
MTSCLSLEVCNISPQLFTQKMWVLFALHLRRSSVVLFRISLKPERSEGLRCLTSENSVNKARLVTYTIS